MLASSEWLPLAVKVVLTLWFATVAVWDRLMRRVPNGLVLPVMFGALAWQFFGWLRGASRGVLVAWTLTVLLLCIVVGLMALAERFGWQRSRLNRFAIAVLLVVAAGQFLSWVGRAPSEVIFVLVSWFVLFMMWRVHIFGGGDTKLLMALFALFPTIRFFILFALVKLIVSIPLLVLKYVRQGIPNLLPSTRHRIQLSGALPTAEKLQTQGQPNCWTLVLPGVIYLWWVS